MKTFPRVFGFGIIYHIIEFILCKYELDLQGKEAFRLKSAIIVGQSNQLVRKVNMELPNEIIIQFPERKSVGSQNWQRLKQFRQLNYK